MAKQDLTAGAAKAIAAPVGDEAAASIWATIQRIPRGNVCSYGEIATRAGLPGRARLVGKVLGQVPDGMAVPWFRVLRSDGRIAFPPQSKAYREQRARLLEEGVRVERGKVKLQDFGWGRNLDRDIWAPPPEPVRTVAKTAKKRVDAPADRAAKTTGTTPAKSARARR